MAARGGDGGRVIVLTLVGVIALALVLPFGVGARVFRAPSGSMQPAIVPGDHLVVPKWSYGYGRYSFAPFPSPFREQRFLGRAPQRGDLAVFRPSPEPNHDFVKRVVGMPGDRIQMINGVLHINDVAVTLEPLGEVTFADDYGGAIRAQACRETLPGGVRYVVLDRGMSELDNTRVFIVPEGQYFMLGDDRDNSADSRVTAQVGYVPLANFIGPVATVLPTSPLERLSIE
ncbi:MAG: signal peptidase I [Hyphomonadaceae bacterium]|nr:signal peptidase I [Hyphomonadaceae bacterium]